MQVKFYYSACIGIHNEDISLLCDPWFTQGIFGGTWYHFPYKKISSQEIGFYEYIYISHIHPDHYDPIWLKEYISIFPKTKIIICDWGRANPLAMKMNRDLIPYYSISSLTIGNTDIRIIPHDTGSPSDIDSALLISSKSGGLVNMNDCIWDPEFWIYSHSLFKEIHSSETKTVGFYSFTPAGPYPHTYWWNKDCLSTKAAQHEKNFLDKYISKTKVFNCDINVPFAGQYILGSDLHRYNEFRGACDATKASKLEPNSVVLKEWGEGYIDLKNDLTYGQRFEPYTTQEYQKRIDQIKNISLEYMFLVSNELSKRINIKNLIISSFDKAIKKKGFVENYIYTISIDKLIYIMDLSNGSLNIINDSEEIQFPNYTIHKLIIERRLLVALLLGVEHWDNAEKGSMYMSSRNPDRFSRKAQSFLHFLHI